MSPRLLFITYVFLADAPQVAVFIHHKDIAVGSRSDDSRVGTEFEFFAFVLHEVIIHHSSTLAQKPCMGFGIDHIGDDGHSEGVAVGIYLSGVNLIV